ncbi:MAG: aminotransferase class V-fold PLP-dependent enzyme [Terrimicrobiaceae bacterium]|jgi:cysteine desulfurase|nr:aminotransferase class V-fold PLP-dependent enzyme [Terrimicrobiaceae bacterium]
MIYLDHNATTPVLPEVVDAMMPFFREEWGNPSSSYRFGSRLKKVIETARDQVAELLGAHPLEIIFTSGGTECDNAALHAMLRADPAKQHIITSAVEHSAVLTFCRELEKTGFRITYLPVDRDGLLSITDLENAITPETAGVSLMWANNETGVLFPVEEIAPLCRSRGILFHCDAVQAAGKIPIDLKNVPVDYLSLTGHKIGAPKGVGALFVRRKAPFTAYIQGGHQERGRRGGTENVPLVAGLGMAADIARKKAPAFDAKVRPLRDEFENGILTTIPQTELNGHPALRLANTTDITFYGIESEALLLLLDQAGICASSGSACLADSPDPSHVVAAMKPGSAARQCVRFSLGIENTAGQIREALKAIRSNAATLGTAG